jgi:tetratricopeptide (TPR) repeat protein
VAQEGIDLPGIGDKLLQRLEHQLGGREELIAALDRGDVAQLSSVQGISRRRAVRMVQAHRGDSLDWLVTDDAEPLAREALEPFLDRAVTKLGRARLETLAPAGDEDTYAQRLDELADRLDELADHDLDDVVDALEGVQHPSEPRPQPERDVAVLLDEGPVLEGVRERDLDRWVEVVTENDAVDHHGVVLSATTGPTPQGAVHVTVGRAWEAVPWADRAWAETNRELLEALAQLAELLDVDDHATPILEALEAESVAEPPELGEIARECVDLANETVEEEIEDVSISGQDVLEVMQGGRSKAVQTVISEAQQQARERFKDETGLVGAPFSDEYPLEVDRQALERLEREQRQDRALERYRAAKEVAAAVQEHRDGVEAMVSQAIELDRWQAVARATEDLDLGVPEPADGFSVEGALHLDLRPDGTPVDYPLPDGVALLTGANSGGKTTLIETLAQIAWLAHLGLPVPADEAQVPLLDGLAYYERPRQLGAGAFEGFLRTIEDLLLDGEDVLVLADELEAMTELEAAAAILAEVVERLDARQAPAVLVTHLAPYILEHVDARTDGIEAKGLDEDNQLVVDRTPKVDVVARSTPELILQRLRNTAEDEREQLYESMIERLGRE